MRNSHLIVAVAENAKHSYDVELMNKANPGQRKMVEVYASNRMQAARYAELNCPSFKVASVNMTG
jgi:hypothetical protein